MISQKMVALRATLATPRIRAGLGLRLRATLRGVLARRADGPTAVYSDADARIVFAIRSQLEFQEILLRRAHQ